MLIVVVQFPDKSWSGGGSILDPGYTECDRYFCPGSACNRSVGDAIKVVSKLSKRQREMLQAATNAVLEANDRGATVEFPEADERSVRSMVSFKKIFELVDGGEGKPFVVRLNK